MRHQEIAAKVLAEMHEPWMSEAEKEEFNAEMLKLFGLKLDADISDGLSRGFTEEQLILLVRSIVSKATS